ncbi:DHH family phosphoesterase [Radiobacillus sp. PE A8.2]|uniref:DHH family phosphoesterase n=1 Tax=Radiobacillus sp. PE A8.2 TaxID=3380349 RepID=UPI00388D4739
MYKLLSHNDLDGVGCGIIAKLAFDKQVNVRYNSISGLDREVKWFLENENEDTFLFITDLSVSKENETKLEEFYQSSAKLQLIDHHKSATAYNDYEWASVVVEDDKGNLTSATSLFYEYLIGKGLMEPSSAVSEFVELVRQYDTWEWEKNDNLKAKRLNALFFLVSIEEFEQKMLHRLTTSNHFDFDEFEQKILQMEEHKIERYIKKKKRELVQTQLNNHFAGVVYAEMYHSELGNELGKEFPHLDYIVILNIGGRRMGFRTIHDNVDVSAIAATFGGGGHAKASGAKLTEDAYKYFVAATFQLEPLKEDAKQNSFNVKESTFGAMYKNRDNDMFFVYFKNEQEWVIKQNQEIMEQTFSSFEETEQYLKRYHQAWLVRDEYFVNYLIEEVKKTEQG